MSCNTCLTAAMEIVTGCECPAPGFCTRHNCEKVAHWHNLCKTRPDYFRLWESGGGPCTNRKASVAPPRIGLGDVIAWMIRIATFGRIKPTPWCGCEAKKTWLNKLVSIRWPR